MAHQVNEDFTEIAAAQRDFAETSSTSGDPMSDYARYVTVFD
jgi:hypothetical protein